MVGRKQKREVQEKLQPELPATVTSGFDFLLQRIPAFDDSSVLTNGVFLQVVREVFVPLLKQVGELASAVGQLRIENENAHAELRKQQVELQALRAQLAVQTTMGYVPARLNASTNVLIHGVAEEANETAMDLRRSALTHLRALDATPNLLASDILSVSRLGLAVKKGRQRPLVVKFKDTSLPTLLAKASYNAYKSNKDQRQHQPYVTRHIIRQSVGQWTKATKLNLNGTQKGGVANKSSRASAFACKHLGRNEAGCAASQ